MNQHFLLILRLLFHLGVDELFLELSDFIFQQGRPFLVLLELILDVVLPILEVLHFLRSLHFFLPMLIKFILEDLDFVSGT
mmetsp:Transcript_39293/g.37732  ORF Transcript_39293/g.37732 Transcript_39293/m.37732 type:complete len:81 (-) Transcript_39293:1120-1362(-)